MFDARQLEVCTLGPRRVRSPLPLSTVPGDDIGDFVDDRLRVLSQITFLEGEPPDVRTAFEAAGPREYNFFEPDETTAAIVTCGGLCPGLNNVIRGLFFQLHANYGVPRVLGIRYGYAGLNPEVGQPPLELTGDIVEESHKMGGTLLGSSRGDQPVEVMAQFLQRERIDILFCVGGDGTQRGAHALVEELNRRGLPISIIGIPKTIDNDIPLVDQSFGFDTALEKAVEHISGAHNEARGVPRGIGLVKLMGRHAGYIAAGATLASGQVNFTLIPEVPFRLHGEGSFLEKLARRMDARKHAVIVIAEGAGQDLLPPDQIEYDRSGNRKLGNIGPFLQDEISRYFQEIGKPVNIKYFDPSYHIRSVPANCADSVLCHKLARRAAHAAMAGKTDMLVGLTNDHFVHVPLPLVTSQHKQVDPESDLWMGVLAATGQERW